KLEGHYKDMQDCEFTVEDGQLYMLQTRNAKRPAQAAVRFATDAVDEGLLTTEEALRTIDAAAIDTLLHPVFDPTAEYKVIARGAGEVRAGDVVLHEGDVIAIDGSQGIVTADDVPLVDPADDPEFEPILERLWAVLEWADGVRRLAVRANADTPADAKRAREF